MVQGCPTGRCEVYHWKCSVCRDVVDELLRRERNAEILRGVARALLTRIRDLTDDDVSLG